MQNLSRFLCWTTNKFVWIVQIVSNKSAPDFPRRIIKMALMAGTQSMVVSHQSAGLIFDAIVCCVVSLSGLGNQCWRIRYVIHTQIAKFLGPTWSPPGSCRPQMGPMFVPWTLLSGYSSLSIKYNWITGLKNRLLQLNFHVTKSANESLWLRSIWQSNVVTAKCIVKL